MADNVVGSVVGKIRFSIDKKSWDNLALFQNKLTSIKRQMTSMDKSIKVNAVVSQINKVANATVNAEKKVADARENSAKRQAKTFKQTGGDTVGHVGLWKEQLKAKQRESKLVDRANRNRTAFEAGVDNFMLIKESQLNQYADRVRMGREQRAEMMGRLGAAKESALKGIDPTQARAIESFRAQVNKTKNEMVNFDRITRANAVSFRSLRNEVVQLTAAYTAFSVVQNVAESGMMMEGLRASAKVFAKDEAGVAEHMSFIADEANRIGVNFQTAAQEFTKFSISTKNKFDSGTQRTLFSGISEYAAVLQIDQMQYQRLFKSIQQMSDKGLYAEEIYGQMAEAAPGSVEALAKAFGFTDTAAFRKRVEQGGLQLDADKAKAFAQELRSIANANGALGEVTKKTRAELNRFLNQLTYAKDEIFQGGMDDGLSALFGTLADTLENLKPIAKVIGALFKGVVSVLTGAFKLLITPIEIVTQSIAGLWGMLGATGGEWGQKIWNLVGAGGVLALLAMRFKFIQNVIFGANATLLIMMKNLARIAVPLLAIEDIWGSMQGKRSATGQGGAWSAEGLFGKSFSWMDKPIGSFFGETKVVVEVRGDEAAKFITTTVEQNNQQRNAINQTETSQ